MLKKRIIIVLTFKDGILYRTKNFKPDYRYTKNFVDFWSIDELILIDVSEKKFQKNFLDIIKSFSRNCFVPISVGGGIKSLADAEIYFKYGADKIILGYHSINNFNLIKDISRKYGNQSVIQSIDYKKNLSEYISIGKSGSAKLDISPITWAKQSLEHGAGEILLNSIDDDGSLLGYNIKFIEKVSNLLKCPILVLGGCGNWSQILDLFNNTQVSAACTQNIYHFTNESITSAKNFLIKNNINVRK